MSLALGQDKVSVVQAGWGSTTPRLGPGSWDWLRTPLPEEGDGAHILVLEKCWRLWLELLSQGHGWDSFCFQT